jgi:subtilisin family serine protease
MPIRFARHCFWLLAFLTLAASLSPAEARNLTQVAPESTLLGPSASARYVIQLSDAPLLTYDGGLAGYPATALGAEGAAESGSGRPQLDLAAPAALRYTDYLTRQQAAFEADLMRIAPGATAQYHYRVALNGVTVRLTPDQATEAARLPGVVAVTREERIVPLMDASLGQVGAPAAWADARIGGRAGAGQGIRIAVIDSGITAAHPFFDDTGFTAPPGFPKSTLTVGDTVTPYGAEDLARYTNDKVIVARAYANPEVFDAAAPTTPLADGLGGFHGAHVAGTAAGGVTQGAPGSSTGGLDLSGVAPGAYLMAYKFTDAYTPEILRMIEDAVTDGADVINNSWGTSAMNVMDAEHHPISQAFKAATAAGVVVVAAAGNAGTNGEATLGGPHQMIDEVITVGNVQTGRSFAYYLYASDTDLPAELEKHPAAYEAFENEFSVIEAPAVRGVDMCNPLSLAIAARGKIILDTTSGSCAIPGFPIQLPEQLGFLTKLIFAGTVNAASPVPLIEAVVFFAEEGDPAQLGAILQGLNTLKPILQDLLGLDLKFPITAIIAGDKAVQLAAWADAHPTLNLKLDPTPARIMDPALVDAANATTSQGPTPRGGLGWGPLKPDLSAPGTDILSTNTTAAGEPNGFTTASGTSMASPHVTGAVAVLRQAWPEWTPAEIKAALMTTADPVVKAGGALAPATVQGAGRLNLARAIDPGLLVTPANLSWDAWELWLRHSGQGHQPAEGPEFVLRDVRQNPEGSVVYAVSEEPGVSPELGRNILNIADGSTVTVPAGSTAKFVLTENPDDNLQPGSYDGRIAFSSPNHTVRVLYRIVVSGDKKDVLLVNVRRSAPATGGGGGIPGLPGGGAQLTDTPDYSAFWTVALEEAGLSYDVWTVAEGAENAAPPLSKLQQYNWVILAAGDGNAPLDQMANGMTSLQMYLLGGGRMLVSGYNYPHAASNPLGIQSSGAMMFLSRYFGGFERTTDDVAPAGTLGPVRLFPKPIQLATTASADAAGNGGKIDLGQPLKKLQTLAAGAAQLPLDQGIAAPLVVDKLMPYMRSYIEIDGGGSAMTGVTPDATLEQPTRADFIGWQALFAGFGFEAISPTAGYASRAEMLKRIHSWVVEPADYALTLDGPAAGETGKPAAFTASGSSATDVQAVAWRWDAGDGRGYITSTRPELALTYTRRGTYTVRVEATTAGGHTWVAERTLVVGGKMMVFLPALLKSERMVGR